MLNLRKQWKLGSNSRLRLADDHNLFAAHGVIKTIGTQGMTGWTLLIDQ